MATPLLNAAVYFFIFGLLLGARRGIPSDVYVPFLVTGVFVFTFTQSPVLAAVPAISGNLGLVRALHFPLASLPISFALQQLQQLLFSMIVLVVIMVAFRSYPDLSWLLVVPALALQFVFRTLDSSSSRATRPTTTCSPTANCRPTRSAASCSPSPGPPPRSVRRSDAICTALQIVEHLQDVAEDLGRDRIYHARPRT
ncbi:hypothetical protein SALBM217S_04811 [Streptomyces griseoloalbus]